MLILAIAGERAKMQPMRIQEECKVLFLNRKVGESVVLDLPTGERVTVSIEGVCPGYYRPTEVKIGIEAPESVSVDRTEVRERKVRELVGWEEFLR